MRPYLLTWTLLIVVSTFLLAGCGEPPAPPKPTGNHVWKDLTNTLDKARNAEKVIQDAADRERHAIDAQTSDEGH